MPKPDFSMPVAELAQMLAQQAEAVCRDYLPAGRHEGRYWLVEDVHNTPGPFMRSQRQNQQQNGSAHMASFDGNVFHRAKFDFYE